MVETLRAEVAGLREQFQAGGPARLAPSSPSAPREPGSSLYLLVDTAGRRSPAICDRVPPELGGRRPAAASSPTFAQRRTGPGKPRLAVGVPAAVPGGLTLVVGRDIEDLRRFAGTWAGSGCGASSFCPRSASARGLAHQPQRVAPHRDGQRHQPARSWPAICRARIPLDGSGDELDRLAESLNAMLARIEELMGALREVSDNIAHDLKTPLNRLRNRAEAALRSTEGAGILPRWAWSRPSRRPTSSSRPSTRCC